MFLGVFPSGKWHTGHCAKARQKKGIFMSEVTYWNKIRSRQISRRAMLGASARAGVGAAGLALVGCGDDDDDEPAATTAAEQQEQQEQTQQEAEQEAQEQAVAASPYDLDASLGIAWGAFTSTLDVHTQAGFGGHAGANLLMFGRPFARGSDLLALQGGAFDWEFADQNEKILVTSNPGWQYHDGTPLSIEDLQFNLERTGGRWAGDPNFVGRAANLVGIGDIEQADATSGKLDMTEPSPGIPNVLSRLYMTPQGHVEREGADGVSQNPVGHGPYKFVDWRQDEVINSTRFDEYGNGRDFDLEPRLGYIKDLQSKFIPEEQARLAALESGEIDLALQIIPDLARPYEDMDDFQVWYHSAQRGMHLQLPKHLNENPTGGGPNPWRDVRVRMAANLAVDQDALINNIMTGRENRTYTLAVGQAGHDGAEGPISDLDWGYDPDRARALLAEAGWGDGFEAVIGYPQGLYTNVDVFIQAVANWLTEVGIRTTVETQEISQYFSDLREDGRDTLFLFPQAAGLDPLIAIRETSRLDAVFAHRIEDVSDPEAFQEIEDLYDAAQVEFDTEKRNNLLNQGARRFYQQAGFIFLFELVQPLVARAEYEWPQYAAKPAGIEAWNVRKRA